MTTNIIIYGADWCRDCVRSKEILEDHGLEYEYRDITDPKHGSKYSDYVIEVNNGKRIIPTLIINDDVIINPSASEREKLLNSLKKESREIVVTDSNGNILANGDSVILSRDLDVKGSGLTLKQGTSIEKIILTDRKDYVDARIGKSTISIKTMYLKKKN